MRFLSSVNWVSNTETSCIVNRPMSLENLTGLELSIDMRVSLNGSWRNRLWRYEMNWLRTVSNQEIQWSLFGPWQFHNEKEFFFDRKITVDFSQKVLYRRINTFSRPWRNSDVQTPTSPLGCTQVHSHSTPCDICCGWSGTSISFISKYFSFLLLIVIPPMLNYHSPWGMR